MTQNMSGDILTLSPPSADARIRYGSDPNQFFDLRLPSPNHMPNHKSERPHSLVINIHGGFWRSRYSLDHAGHLCAALTGKGLATANVEYRRVGNEGGGWPGTFADIRMAYNVLVHNEQQHNFDSKKILVMGHSAGGQLALCLAAHERGVERVISLAGVVDLERAYQLHLSNDAVSEFLRGAPAEVPDHYREADPMQLSIPHVRQVLIHGSVDDVVPPDFGRDYVAAKQKRTGKQKEDVQLIEIAGAGHFDLIDPRSAAWKTVEQTVFRLFG
ncbi:MAG: alpha/beta hydrolase [Terriglobales bacterium]|jgi:acetyl esterase/lipase